MATIVYAAEIEGPIEKVQDDGANGAILIVLGVTVKITPKAFAMHRVKTPTKYKTVTHAQLVNAPLFPGRKDLPANIGFLGGTAIVTGNFDPATGVLVVDFDPKADPAQNQEIAPFEAHPLVEVGPPENVLLGPFTGALATSPLSVNNVPVLLLKDFTGDFPLVGDPVQNEFGFDIDPETIPTNAPASVEGYLSDTIKVDDKFAFIGFNFVVDSTVPTLLVNGRPQVSIVRARAVNEGTQYKLDIRGGIHTPVGQDIGARPTLSLFGFDLNADIRNPLPINDRLVGGRRLAPGGFERWRFNAVLPGSAPERMMVEINGVNGPDGKPIASEPEYVDIRKA